MPPAGRGARACARMGRGRPGLIRGCLSHTSRRYPDLVSGCRVVCRGDKHGNAPICNKQELTAADVRFDRLALAQDPALALQPSPAASPCSRPWPCNKQEMTAADVQFD